MASSILNRPPRRRLGLTGRIAVALGLVALVPLAVALGPALGANRDALIDQVLRTHLVATRATTARVVAAVDERRSLAAALATNVLVTQDPASETSQEILRATLASDPALLALVIRDPSGAEVVRVRRRGVDPPEAGTPGVTFSRTPAGPFLFIRQTLERPLGDLLLVVDGVVIDTLLAPEDLGQDASLSLLGADGETLAGNPDAPQPPELAQPASRRVRGATRWRATDTLVVAAWEPVPDTDWLVVSTQPARIAERIAIAARRTTLIAGGLGVTLALLSAAIAHRSIVRPIRRVLGAQRRLAGRAGEDAPEGNEIHQLGRSLEALARWGEERRQLGSLFVGRYEVQELLGEGAMGAVWRAWDPRLRRAIALKTIRLAVADPEQRRHALDLLAAEAAAAAQVSHPNLVAVYDLAESPDAAFVAMELVEGRPLDRLLDRRELADWRDVLALGAAIARGLAAAHERGLVHRDVKPSNVLVGADGSVKLADFGLAGLAGHTTPTEDGKVFGTPGYVAPEVLMGEPATPASDLFALGALLWEALAGHHPFRSRTVAKTLRATLDWSATGLGAVRPDLPKPAVEVIESCLARDPAARPGSAGLVAFQLEQLARGGADQLLDRRRVPR